MTPTFYKWLFLARHSLSIGDIGDLGSVVASLTMHDILPTSMPLYFLRASKVSCGGYLP